MDSAVGQLPTLPTASVLASQPAFHTWQPHVLARRPVVSAGAQLAVRVG